MHWRGLPRADDTAERSVLDESGRGVEKPCRVIEAISTMVAPPSITVVIRSDGVFVPVEHEGGRGRRTYLEGHAQIPPAESPPRAVPPPGGRIAVVDGDGDAVGADRRMHDAEQTEQVEESDHCLTYLSCFPAADVCFKSDMMYKHEN